MELKIKVADLPPEGIDIPINITEGQCRAHWEPDTTSEPTAASVSGKLHADPSGRRVVVRGKVAMKIKTACGRCLEDFVLDAEESIFVVYTPAGDAQSTEELDSDSVSEEVFSGEEIDLWPIIEEYLEMSLPIKPLCADECRGLCSICGRNLNQGQCQCRTETGHSGLAGLMEIRDKLPKA